MTKFSPKQLRDILDTIDHILDSNHELLEHEAGILLALREARDVAERRYRDLSPEKVRGDE